MIDKEFVKNLKDHKHTTTRPASALPSRPGGAKGDTKNCADN